MNRREFIRAIIVGAVCSIAAPTHFLTPFSPKEEIVTFSGLTPEMLDGAITYWRDPLSPAYVMIMHPRMAKLYKEVIDG